MVQNHLTDRRQARWVSFYQILESTVGIRCRGAETIRYTTSVLLLRQIQLPRRRQPQAIHDFAMLNPDFAARLKEVFAAQDEGAAFLRFGRYSFSGFLSVLRLRVHAGRSMIASRAPRAASTKMGQRKPVHHACWWIFRRARRFFGHTIVKSGNLFQPKS